MVEFVNGNNYNPGNFGDYNQDLWNDWQGSQYNPLSGMSPAEYAKHLYDNGDLILSNDPAEQDGQLANPSFFLGYIASDHEALSAFNEAIDNAFGDAYDFLFGDAEGLAESVDGEIQGNYQVIKNGDTEYHLTLLSNITTIAVEDESYLLRDVMKAFNDAASATSQFVATQAGNYWDNLTYLDSHIRPQR